MSIARYRYDGRNRRIVKLTYAGGILAETRHVYYTNEWRAIEERVDLLTLADRQYVWGLRYIDELVCRDRPVTGGTERLYALQDANFNVSAVVNTAGAVGERYQYDPYGSCTVLDANFTADADGASDVGWIYLHQGARYDAATGLYFFNIGGNGRDYSPALGRWQEQDRWRRDADRPTARDGYPNNLSRYESRLSNPIRYLDPTGELPPGFQGPRPTVPPHAGRPHECPHKKPRPGFVPPKPNGCGSANGLTVRGNANMPGAYFYDFNPACDSHDKCYDTCGPTKTDCDDQFAIDLQSACDKAFSEVSIGYLVCVADAMALYALVLYGGQGAYDAAQDNACVCGCAG